MNIIDICVDVNADYEDDEIMKFNKKEFTAFWYETQKSLIGEFVKHCEKHEMMISCKREIGDIEYLAKDYIKSQKHLTA